MGLFAADACTLVCRLHDDVDLSSGVPVRLGALDSGCHAIGFLIDKQFVIASQSIPLSQAASLPQSPSPCVVLFPAGQVSLIINKAWHPVRLSILLARSVE